MRRSHLPTCSSRLPRNTRNCIDSGNRKIISTPITSGTTPPTWNTDCQPKRGINAADSKPPSTAPKVKPHETSIIRVTRLRTGLYSPASAIAFGMIAPSPRPVTKRSTMSCPTVPAMGVSNMQAAKNKVAAINTGRRPMRSARMLKQSEPTSMPNKPAPNTGPRLALAMPHSWMMAGAT